MEGVAAINLAAKGQVVGAFAPFKRGLQQHYGVSRDAVAFWDVHELADVDPADVGDHIVVTHATSREGQAGVRRALETSPAMWWQFFDGIDRR